MRAVLRLELIADDYFWHKRRGCLDWQTELRHLKRLGSDKSPAWVARLLPGMQRQYLQGTRDYSQANHDGSRGIYEFFPLADGLYEVNERVHWRRVRRYFLRVESGSMAEISREEAEQWLQPNTNSISVSTS